MANNRRTVYKILHRFNKFSAWDEKGSGDAVELTEEIESTDFEKCLYFDRLDLNFEFDGLGKNVSIQELKEAIRKVEENPANAKYTSIYFENVYEHDGHYCKSIICGERSETDEEFNTRMLKNAEYNKFAKEEKLAKRAERERKKIEKAKILLEKYNSNKQRETT